MKNKGLGENTEFSAYHPLVNTLYFVLVVGITMFSMSPYFLAVTFLMSWAYSVLLKGADAVRINGMMTLS